MDMNKINIKQGKGTTAVTAGGSGGGGGQIKAPQPSPDSFKYTCMAKEDHKKAVYGCQFNHLLKPDEPPILATVGSNRISIYECLPKGVGLRGGRGRIAPGGGLKLIRVFADPNVNEVFYCCAWGETEDGTILLAAAGLSGIVRVLTPTLSTTTMNPKACQGHGGAVNDLRFHPRNRNLLLSASKDHSLRLWNIKKDSCVCVAVFGGIEGHRDELLSVDIDITGFRIVTGGMDHSIKIWNLKKPEIESHIRRSYRYNPQTSGKPFPTFSQHFPDFSTRAVHKNYVDCAKWLGDFILSKSCQNEFVCWKPGRPLQKWDDLAMGDSTRTLLYAQDIEDCELWFIRFSLHFWQKRLAVGNDKGKLYIYDLAPTDLKLLPKPTVLSHPNCTKTIRQTAWSRDGKVLICVCEDATIWRWDIQEADEVTVTNITSPGIKMENQE